MSWLGYSRSLLHLFINSMALAVFFFSACCNSVLDVEADEQSVLAKISQDESSSSLESSSSKAKSSSSVAKSSSSQQLKYPESFKPNDKEFPYAGIPRIVIETGNRKEIKDRETEIPAKMQIWGDSTAESEIMGLTIRGRGNSSWNLMPKKSYKIEFEKKQSMLGMPKDKDWTLIANYADKTLMKNYLVYNLSANLGAYYSPRCEFVELFLNDEYLGVYLLTETIKVSKNRIDIPQNEDSYLVEIDGKYKNGEQVVFSDIIPKAYNKNSFRIHEPKNASENALLKFENYIQTFELFLKKIDSKTTNDIDQWIDIYDYIRYYWVQEFSKNPDAVFSTSVYFIWEVGDVIKMGPVWDFDISFGGHNDSTYIHPENWYVKDACWNAYLFKDSTLNRANIDYWIENKQKFANTLDVIDSMYNYLEKAAKNNFEKWNILQSTDLAYFHYRYSSYKEAVDDLKKWIDKRIQWIDSQIE